MRPAALACGCFTLVWATDICNGQSDTLLQRRSRLQEAHETTEEGEGSAAGCPSPLPSSFCPAEGTWLDEMVRIDPRPATVFVDIGCNKGTNLIKALERYDPGHSWSTNKFIAAGRELGMLYDVQGCPQSQHPAPAINIKDVGANLNAAAGPIGICVEPMPSTFRAVQAVVKNLGYQANYHMVHAAVVKQVGSNHTVPFPDAAPGQEALGISSSTSYKIVDVPAVTVDGLMAERRLTHVDFLHVDTEGWDPDVLAGAQQTLNVTRYVMFEVHRDISNSPWSRTPLKAVLDLMGQKRFTCYWATNSGILINMHLCWDDAWESSRWSNAACVKNGDPWAPVFQQLR